MSRQRARRCETCQHWTRNAQPGGIGRCHAPHLYSPLIVLTGILARLHTHAHFGCVCWVGMGEKPETV